MALLQALSLPIDTARLTDHTTLNLGERDRDRREGDTVTVCYQIGREKREREREEKRQSDHKKYE